MTELNAAEQAAEQVLTDAMPHLVGLVADSLARAVAEAVRGPMYHELSGRVEAAMAAKAEETALEIAAVSLETAAKSWMAGGHDHQGTSPSLWMRDRAAYLRAADRQAEWSGT